MRKKRYEQALQSLVAIADLLEKGEPPELAIIKVLGLNEALLYIDEKSFWNAFLDNFKGTPLLQTIALLIRSYSLDPNRIGRLISRLLALAKLEQTLIEKRDKLANKLSRYIKLLSGVSAYCVGALLGFVYLSSLSDIFNKTMKLLPIPITVVIIVIVLLILSTTKTLIYISLRGLSILTSLRPLLSRTLLVSTLSLIAGFLLSALLLL